MNYCILTYSHRNCSDLWNPYIERIRKYGPKDVEHFLMVDTSKNFLGQISYDENDPFSVQMIKALTTLKSIGFDYFIYSQEDFILYDYVLESAVRDSIERIKSKNTDFVKLIKSGGTEYCMQASVHSIDEFISFYSKYQIDSIREEGFLSRSSIGEYESKYLPEDWVGNKRGADHYDSKVWPYIATALVKGKWNLSEYKKELTAFRSEFDINFDQRGIF
jgi:hypothetical protein